MSNTRFLQREAAPGRVPAVRLLDAVPDMQLAIPEDEREQARTTVLAPTRTWSEGPFQPPATSDPAHPFALLILDGALLRTAHLADRAATEIFGEGDVIDAAQAHSWPDTPVEHTVHQVLTVAVLDDRFRVAARRWPRLHDAIYTQMAGQRRAATAHMAMLHLPRVDERILVLFEHLADRWGVVTSEGIAVRLRLHHNVIGQLVASRRPTVTLALMELAAQGKLERRDDRTWLLPRTHSAAPEESTSLTR